MTRAATYLFAALVSASPLAALAGPVAIDFSLTSSIGGPVTGTGTAVTDSSHLAPGAFTVDFADLLSMTMTLSGIPASPATTTFTRADLNAPDSSWILTVDDWGSIIDLNFFMRNDGTNADGFSLDGFEPFNFALCQGPALNSTCTTPALDQLVVSVTDVHQASAPLPGTLGLLATALVCLGAVRRRQGQPANVK